MLCYRILLRHILASLSVHQACGRETIERYDCGVAAEANILGDPEAADYVFGQTERIRCLGLDVTLTCQIPNSRLATLKDCNGRFGPFLHQIIQFYLKYHR